MKSRWTVFIADPARDDLLVFRIDEETKNVFVARLFHFRQNWTEELEGLS